LRNKHKKLQIQWQKVIQPKPIFTEGKLPRAIKRGTGNIKI